MGMRFTWFVVVLAVTVAFATSRRADKTFAKAAAGVIAQCKAAATAYVENFLNEMENRTLYSMSFPMPDVERRCGDTGADRLAMLVDAFCGEGFFVICDPEQKGVGATPNMITGKLEPYMNVSVFALDPNLDLDKRPTCNCPMKKPILTPDAPVSQ